VRAVDRITIRAALALARAIAILKFGGVRRALAWTDRAPRVVASSESPASMVRAVNRAGRYVPGATCLAKSIALVRLLRGRGLAASVRFGTLRGDTFAAHAWVECGGVELTGSNGATPFEPATAER